MDSIVTFIVYGIFGLFGLLGILIVFALLFGKRVSKQWEFEAEFRDERGREFGEFEIELSQIEKEEPVPTVKAELQMRHDSLQLHKTVQAYVGDRLLLEGTVTRAGRIRIERRMGEGDAGSVSAGQTCRIVIGGSERFSEPLRRD